MGGGQLRVVVAGGGITGLAAAHALVSAGADVTLVERSTALGGKVATERVAGFVLERGPDSFFAQRPAALDLARDLGLADEVVAPRGAGGTFAWHDGRLVPLPAGMALGVPTRCAPFLLSPLVPPLAKARAALEVAVPPERTAADVSIGAFLRRRLGNAVVDRLAGPLVSAVYGASADELSLDAVMPHLREAVRRHGSLVRAGLAARGAAGAGGPPLVTLRRGMGSLVEALAARLAPVDVRLGACVRSIERVGGRYRTRLAGGSCLDADAVVLAVPAPAAARALAEAAPAAADALASIVYRGTAVVSLAYHERQLTVPLPGHGFVAADGALPVVACTWSSVKWPERAPAGYALARATVRSEERFGLEDDALAEAAHAALARVIGVAGRPALARVTRWEGAMPRYTVGHLDRLARIDAALQPFPGVVVAGAAYRGAGVADCVAQGQAAAQRVLGGAGPSAAAGVRTASSP